MTKEKIIDTVRKLHQHAKSADAIGSEEEAQAFATKVQELLAKHNLSMTDIEWQQEIQQKVSTVFWMRADKARLADWMRMLANVIAQGNSCRIMTGAHVIQFIGLEQNISVSKETMEYLYNAAEGISWTEYDKRYNDLYTQGLAHQMKGYRQSFLSGFVFRLRSRIKEQQDALKAQFASKSTALVRLSDAMKLADDYVKEKAKKTVKLELASNNVLGYKDGVAKANTLNVSGELLAQGVK